jgi:hypothetical protein
LFGYIPFLSQPECQWHTSCSFRGSPNPLVVAMNGAVRLDIDPAAKGRVLFVTVSLNDQKSLF